MATDLTHFVLPDGTSRKMGNIPADPGRLKAWPTFGAVPQAKVVPEDEWKDRIDEQGNDHESDYLPPVHDQDGVGMCNLSATTGGTESQRMKQGLPYVKLSAGDAYKRICGGGDNGSTLEDGIHLAMAEGMASVATCPYLDWRTTHSAAVQERPKYRVLEALLCPTFAHCISAVLGGYDLISGIWWYNNYNPTADGWLPAPAGGRGGHAVHGYKGAYRTRGTKIEYGIWHQNSWGKWGYKNLGLCVFPRSVYTAGGIGGWWAIRGVVDEGGVVPMPK